MTITTDTCPCRVGTTDGVISYCQPVASLLLPLSLRGAAMFDPCGKESTQLGCSRYQIGRLSGIDVRTETNIRQNNRISGLRYPLSLIKSIKIGISDLIEFYDLKNDNLN